MKKEFEDIYIVEDSELNCKASPLPDGTIHIEVLDPEMEYCFSYLRYDHEYEDYDICTFCSDEVTGLSDFTEEEVKKLPEDKISPSFYVNDDDEYSYDGFLNLMRDLFKPETWSNPKINTSTSTDSNI